MQVLTSVVSQTCVCACAALHLKVILIRRTADRPNLQVFRHKQRIFLHSAKITYPNRRIPSPSHTSPHLTVTSYILDHNHIRCQHCNWVKPDPWCCCSEHRVLLKPASISLPTGRTRVWPDASLPVTDNKDKTGVAITNGHRS